MDIRRPLPTDPDALLAVWLRAVRATHGFVSVADLQAMTPAVRDYLGSSDADLWILHEGDRVLGFMGMAGSKMEALFLDPDVHRRGGGRMLVRHARSLHGELTVDVNEQNPGARAFYEACGFVVEGRSELDEQGRPYPLLHMRSSPSVSGPHR